jgi:transcriptional regulator with XRE-family HTH domain
MSENLGQLEVLAREDSDFAAHVAVAEFVRGAASLLKAMRGRTTLTQAQLGEKLGLSQGRISQIESGLMDYAPNLETIALYASACSESLFLRASGGGPLAVIGDPSLFRAPRVLAKTS